MAANEHSLPVLQAVEALSEIGGPVTVDRLAHRVAMRASALADALTVCLLRGFLGTCENRKSFWLTDAGGELVKLTRTAPPADVMLVHSDSEGGWPS